MKPLTIRAHRMGVFRLIRQGLALLAIVVMLPTFAVMPSCGSVCSGTCDRDALATYCINYAAAKCPASDCVVRSGCHCVVNSDGTMDSEACGISACAFATDAARCPRSQGCEWGDACQDRVNCTEQTKDTCDKVAICNWVPAC